MTEQDIEALGQEAFELVCDIVFDVSGVAIENCESSDALESDIGIEEYHIDNIEIALIEETGRKIDLSSRPLFLDGVVQEVFQALKANKASVPAV
ncbi:hypothetical protein [Rhizobium sp. MHM7A]|uniref:hypothetical protein n=1 Tax=Rhizobium sp. MHM7A TaxID=2583233 RepID=UPI001105DB97|nr:hypothetical protein [Rhizobium sp. MHM7A]TLX16585.1 hypothetical protein FFR93_04395 [Rhizobium sp. MHM7A]